MNAKLSDTTVSGNGQLTEINEAAAPVGKKKFLSYENVGFRDAGNVGGAVQAFAVSIDRFFSRLIRRAEKDTEFLKKKQEEAEAEAVKLENQAVLHEATITDFRKSTMPDLEAQKDSVRAEIRDIRENPQKYTDQSRDSFKFWSLALVLFFITVFIHVFYSSVIYSALFREVKVEKGTIVHSVFYPNVYSEAYHLSTEAFLAALVGPFVFLGFALLMHYFKELKTKIGNISFWSMVGLTLLFDTLLAYQIAKRLYDAERINSFDNKVVYEFWMAVADANFWTVIFFGFVVYFIFGLLYGVFEEERSRRLKLERMIKAREEKLEELNRKTDSCRKEIAELEETIRTLKLQATQIRVPSDRVFYSPHELRRILSNYTYGWMKYLRGGKYDREDLNTITKILNTFYQTKGI
ncbi:MAG: hypothetical protein IT279_14115 [Ignavibacteriaceae bacterium]|nr:hypothetical protein [Ignavibacteriaceae bacterium]